MAVVLGQIIPEEVTSHFIEVLGILSAQASSMNESYAAVLGIVNTDAARERLTETVTNPDLPPRLRADAVTALLYVGDEEACALLIGVMRGEVPKGHFYMRAAAVAALAEIADENALDALLAVARDPAEGWEMRAVCINELGRAGGRRIQGALSSILCGSEQSARFDDVREACAQALGEMRDEASVAGLSAILLDDDQPEGLRADCAAALGDIGGEEAREELQQCVGNAPPLPILWKCRHSLALLKDERAVNELTEQFRKAEFPAHCRADVAKLLGSSPSEAACRLLSSQIFSETGPEALIVSLASIRALGCMKSARAKKALRDVIKSEALMFRVRLEAAFLMLSDNRVAAREMVTQCLNDPKADPQDRCKCAQSLSESGGEQDAFALSACLKDGASPDLLKRACLDGLAAIQRRAGWRALAGGGLDRP